MSHCIASAIAVTNGLSRTSGRVAILTLVDCGLAAFCITVAGDLARTTVVAFRIAVALISMGVASTSASQRLAYLF